MAVCVTGKVQHVEENGEVSESALLCDPCKEDGDSKTADGFCVQCQHYLCDQCFQVHQKPKPLRHHQLLSREEMPMKKVAGSLSEICPRHDKMIEYYCKSHETVGCNSCMFIHDKQCSRIKDLSEMAKEFENSSRCKRFRKRIANCNKVLEVVKMKAKRNKSIAQKCYQEAIENVNKLQDGIFKQFESLREKILQEAKDIQARDIEHIEGLEKAANKADEEVQSLQSDIQTLKETKQNKQLFIAINQSKEMREELENTLEGMNDLNKVKRYIFEPNEFIVNMLQNIDALGELSEYVSYSSDDSDDSDYDNSDDESDNDSSDTSGDEAHNFL